MALMVPNGNAWLLDRENTVVGHPTRLLAGLDVGQVTSLHFKALDALRTAHASGICHDERWQRVVRVTSSQRLQQLCVGLPASERLAGRERLRRVHHRSFQNRFVRRLQGRRLLAGAVSLGHLVTYRRVLYLLTVPQREVAVLHLLVEMRSRQVVSKLTSVRVVRSL